MRIINGQSIAGWNGRNAQRSFEALSFDNCYFEGCSIGLTPDPEARINIKHVNLVACKQRGCIVGPVILDQVRVDGLETGGQMLQAWGSAFRHVTLTGRVGRLMLSPTVVLNDVASPINHAFRKANAAIYAETDWALDIATVEAKELEIQGVPANKIRRDPETQVVVRAAKAIEGNFRELDYGDTHWRYSIQFMLERGEDDVVLVAPKRSPRFKTLLAGLDMLRREGIADAD